MNSPTTPTTTPSRGPILLYALWAFLAIRMMVAAVRHESLRDDMLALPLLGFIIVSAIAGGRIWAHFTQAHAGRTRP